ncbi:hypothetical protein [Amycolatopsis sp.]|uniref:hypothetical protein n=1 Tax=Amycolatopsis sp. TaxID=37632 RepID=UPI002C8D6103|nr:hypothetical protein [Amycolatopsis sp.]HVV09032.1 hypothetical protein [Amycolatopsis sp.]
MSNDQHDFPEGLYNSSEALSLVQLLQPATRAQPQGSPDDFVQPKGGEIAAADYHHFIFGQRGSGKSSLLRYLQRDLRDNGRASIWIDQQIYSNLSYPDVLVSAVLEVMKGLTEAVHNKINPKMPRWKQLLKRIPADQKRLLVRLQHSVNQLEALRFAPIDRRVEWTVSYEKNSDAGMSAGAKVEIVSLGVKANKGSKSGTVASEVVEGTKDQYLERALTEFRDLITRSVTLVSGGFIFVDDLYQIARSDQPEVLGYLHRLVKDTGLWLKIGSIRYSTVTYIPGDPPRGMQIGHDAHEVALDRGLQYFRSAQEFLELIVSKVTKKANVDFELLFTEDARKRLVLAAGGVARDYLRLVSGAITEARNRGVSEKSGSQRVMVEDVNKAAGTIAPSKLEDLKVDEPAEAQALEGLVREITEFCRDRKSAYFLVARDEVELKEQINKLQNLRFTHLLFENETIPDRASQRFDVWLLDVAELSAQRATQGIDFLNWEKREKRRNRRLIYSRK